VKNLSTEQNMNEIAEKLQKNDWKITIVSVQAKRKQISQELEWS
jgi:hypothetical protein